MIRSQDLRIGNKLRVGDIIVTVVEIKFYSAKIQYGDKYSIVEYEKLKPIELDEDRLIELGFVKYRNYYHMYTKDNVLVCYYGKGDLRYGGTYLERKFNYLHELQNALYLLKGE